MAPINRGMPNGFPSLSLVTWSIRSHDSFSNCYLHELLMHWNWFNPLSHNDDYWRTGGKSLLKTLWEKKNMLVTSIFFFFSQCFLPYMACNRQKGTFRRLRKVSFQIGLRSPHRLIWNDTVRFMYLFCLQQVYCSTKSKGVVKCRLELACAIRAG